ncbi:MAG: hypothetical protein H6918_10115 [Sphingomonadaceae bacterium]|nr:hypothetical protein [Sphingomonadaceae bacterium]
MKISRLGFAFVVSAALAACGGGGSSGGSTGGATGGGGTPTPTPPPTTFTYTKFADVTGNVSFTNACMTFETINGFPQWVFSQSFDDFQSINYSSSTETWRIVYFPDSSREQSFGPAEIVTNTAELISYQKTNPNPPADYLNIFGNQPGNVAREYTRAISYGLASGGSPVQAFCTIGIPTDPNDIPSQATVTYTDLLFGGFVLDAVPGGNPPIASSRITGGSGTITGDISTGRLTFDMSIEVTDSQNVVRTLGPFKGTADVTVGANSAGYRGRLTYAATEDVEIVGGFYGPQGTETANVFAVNVDLNNDGQFDQLIFAGLSAKR